MFQFKAQIEIIGVIPYVFVPETILLEILKIAKKNNGPIPICGSLNGNPYRQTLVKFSGAWRFYINTSMLKNSPKRIGEIIDLTISFDPESRAIPIPQKFAAALNNCTEAQFVFDNLPASRKQEIVRYLAKLKSEEILEKNIDRAIQFLLGKERFVGREKP